ALLAVVGGARAALLPHDRARRVFAARQGAADRRGDVAARDLARPRARRRGAGRALVGGVLVERARSPPRPDVPGVAAGVRPRRRAPRRRADVHAAELGLLSLLAGAARDGGHARRAAA